jgi:hypothetical protein
MTLSRSTNSLLDTAASVRDLAVDCKRLRNALEQLDGNVGRREQAIITQTLRPPAPPDQQGAS